VIWRRYLPVAASYRQPSARKVSLSVMFRASASLSTCERAADDLVITRLNLRGELQ
jgi:hypothetical protein